VDNLKRINDRNGHGEGDRCLAEVARTMESAVRKSDRCFRWGGDEFVVVMSDTDRASAAAVLGRVDEAVTQAFEPPGGRAIELSWGLAEREPGASAEDLLAAADLALLETKTDKRR